MNDGTVFMRTNVPCKTVKIRTIRIKMHDGIFRTLTDVWHVLELKKNLISLDALESNGCKCMAKGGVMRVTTCALVVMKG